MLKLKLLVVDDDPDILDLLEITLVSEYNVIKASNGEEALKQARKESPDLLILDYNLPDLQGIEICQILRKDSIFMHTPILMLTGKGETEYKVKGLESGADDYMIKPFAPQELIARVRMLIRRTSINLDANPLTRLPGNVSIHRELEEKIKNKEKIAVLYADIDHFKALNDHYGFERGDRVIKATAHIMINAIQEKGTTNDFIGHIGGDDFVIITTQEAAEDIAKKIIDDFDKTSQDFFDKEDRAKGYIETKGRDGYIQKFVFLTISIGIVTNAEVEFTHIAQISSLGAEVKGYAKKFPQSKYITNRRTY